MTTRSIAHSLRCVARSGINKPSTTTSFTVLLHHVVTESGRKGVLGSGYRALLLDFFFLWFKRVRPSTRVPNNFRRRDRPTHRGVRRDGDHTKPLPATGAALANATHAQRQRLRLPLGFVVAAVLATSDRSARPEQSRARDSRVPEYVLLLVPALPRPHTHTGIGFRCCIFDRHGAYSSKKASSSFAGPSPPVLLLGPCQSSSRSLFLLFYVRRQSPKATSASQRRGRPRCSLRSTSTFLSFERDGRLHC